MSDERRYRLDKDKILLRAKDVGLLIAVLTMLGMLATPMKKVFLINQAIDDVANLKADVEKTKRDVAVIDTQYNEIERQLAEINTNLRRIRRTDDR